MLCAKITIYKKNPYYYADILFLLTLYRQHEVIDDQIAIFEKAMKEKVGIKKPDMELLNALAKSLGPSLYRKDAGTVACSNKDELARIKKNFLIKKLGLADTPKLDVAMKEVCKQFGSSNRNKHRAVFYYLLVKKFRKSAMYKS